MPVTTPKLPPPPRRPQKRSGFSFARGAHELPVGGDDVHRDDVVDRPAEAPRQVAEPAAQREAGDAGDDTNPSTAARPCSCVSRSTSPSRQPAWAARCALGVDPDPRISERSSISAPSATASPAMLWPPPLMRQQESCSRANGTRRRRRRCRGSARPPAAGGRSSRSRPPRARRRPARPARCSAPFRRGLRLSKRLLSKSISMALRGPGSHRRSPRMPRS